MFYDTSFKSPGKWFLDSVCDSLELSHFYRERLEKFAPGGERGQYACALQRILSKHALSNALEDRAIEKALNWQKGDFTYHWSRFYSNPGCTSWLVAGDVSPTGGNIVQKVRDYQGQNHLSLKIYRSFRDRYKIMTVGDLWSSGACAVMNEKGVVITQNDAPGSWQKNTRPVNFGSAFLLRHLAEQCATAAEAVAMLRSIYASGFVRDSDLYFIADARQGFVLETTAQSVACAPVEFGFDVRSNDFVLPGTISVMERERQAYLNGMNRRFSAVEHLRKRLAGRKKLEIADLTDCARLRSPEMESQGWRQVCMKDTISSMMFLPDGEFPETLSTVFLALGPVRHTLFLPIPISLSRLPMALVNGTWAQQAFELKEKMGMDHDKLPDLQNVESRFIKSFFRNRDKARKLLRAGMQTEASALLEEAFFKHFRLAEKFLSLFADK